MGAAAAKTNSKTLGFHIIRYMQTQLTMSATSTMTGQYRYSQLCGAQGAIPAERANNKGKNAPATENAKNRMVAIAGMSHFSNIRYDYQ
jgi:hypothetical protein